MGRADTRRPVATDAELEADFAALGVEKAASLPGLNCEETIEVWAENADSLDAWLACSTQWRAVAPAMAPLIWLGLDYPGVDVVLRRQAPADPDRVFVDLQVMEIEALAAFGEVQE